MPSATDRWADPGKQPGFQPGKRVWFKQTFDGVLYAKEYGASGVLEGKDPDQYQRRLVRFGGEVGSGLVWVPEAHLRLTPPPSLTGKTVKAKEPKPKPRKEAMAVGEELTIFDALAE